MEYKNRNIIVTGGSDGIGRAIAKEFAMKKANLWLVGRNKEKLQKVQKELSEYTEEVYISSVDLSLHNSVIEWVQQVKQKWSRVDVLVNNAGVGIFKPIDELSYDDFDRMYQLNVKTPFAFIKELKSLLTGSKGNVINISSYLAERAMPQLLTSVYSSTKGAVNSLTKFLALELGPEIRINAIAPGTVATSLSTKNISKLPEEKQEELEKYIQQHYPTRQVGAPEDIAHMAVFLASKEAKWITGAVFPVDGGISVT